MLQAHANNIRSRLRLTASALAVATATLGFAVGANAADVTVASGGTYSLYDGTGNTYVVPSGTTAEMTSGTASDASYAALTWPWPILSANSTCLYSGCYTGANKISVGSGGTLIIPNPWYWMELDSMITSYGTVEFQPGSGTGIIGTNYLYGDVVLTDNAGVHFGESWIISNNIFGTDTDFIMGKSTSLYFYEPHTIVNTVNTFSSTDSTAYVYFNNGTMIVNGQNTATSAFYGKIDIQAGATFTVGDESHSSAVFGDPTGSTAVVNVNHSGGTAGVLDGFGTLYGSVNNDGKVMGGSAGVAGTLKIGGNYTQSSTGELVVNVTQSGASKLAVTGSATLDGSLVVNVSGGTYSNAVYTILSASSISGDFSQISVTGNTNDAIVGVASDSTSYYAVVENASSAQTFGHQVTANRHNVAEFTRALYDQIELNSPASGAPAPASDNVDIWLAPVGGIENVGRDGIGYNNDTVGVIGGVEYRTPWQNAVIGLGVSYLNGSLDSKDNSSADSDTFNVAAYGGADVLNARVDGAVFYSGYSTTLKRDIGGSYGKANSSSDGWSWGATLQISKSLFDDLITPYVRGLYAKVHLDDATETGGDSFNLHYGAINENTFVGDVGVRVHILKPSAEQKSKLEVTFAVEHDFSDRGEQVTGSFASITSSSTFEYNWKGDTENALLAGIDFSHQFTDKLDAFVRLDSQLSLHKRAGALSAGVRYHF